MKNPSKLFRIAVLLFAGLSNVSNVQAQACIASATPVTFGLYDPKASSPNDITGSVSVTCQATIALLVAYTVKLNGGASGNIAARKMIITGSQLSYQIYTDATRATVWGDGSGGSAFNVGGYLLSVLVPVTQTYTAYGRIPALQNVYAGSYQDTLTILITY